MFRRDEGEEKKFRGNREGRMEEDYERDRVETVATGGRETKGQTKKEREYILWRKTESEASGTRGKKKTPRPNERGVKGYRR